jgi:hypothetical protein
LIVPLFGVHKKPVELTVIEDDGSDPNCKPEGCFGEVPLFPAAKFLGDVVKDPPHIINRMEAEVGIHA